MPAQLDFVPLDGDYRVINFTPPDRFCGNTLAEFDLQKKFGILIPAIREIIPPRFVFLPSPDFVIEPSDILVMIGKEQDLANLGVLGDKI